ncbi:MAG: aminotransferase V, partial [Deltaproteobacteria bacterium]|nr:aminotransferase V [Deltaproteobacteria bacterium]
EIASTILEEHGYDPLPVYTEPKESPLARPDLTHQFPLVFSSGARVTTDFRSQFHNVPDLVQEQPEPTVTMNSRDAADRNIIGGDLVEVISPRGRVRFRAYVTDNIMPGVVDANMGGGGPGGPPAWPDCNVNDLTDLQRYDPISGLPAYKPPLCEVVSLTKPRH